MLRILLILFLLVSCGQAEDRNRCFTKEEAKNACVLDAITRTGVTSELAEYECSPYYEYEGCYDLNL